MARAAYISLKPHSSPGREGFLRPILQMRRRLAQVPRVSRRQRVPGLRADPADRGTMNLTGIPHSGQLCVNSEQQEGSYSAALSSCPGTPGPGLGKGTQGVIPTPTEL